MTLAGAFAPTGGAFLQVTASPASIALPGGSAAAIMLTNVGGNLAFVQLGGSGIIASPTNGLAIPPNGQINLASGTATYLSAVALQGATGISISTGS